MRLGLGRASLQRSVCPQSPCREAVHREAADAVPRTGGERGSVGWRSCMQAALRTDWTDPMPVLAD